MLNDGAVDTKFIFCLGVGRCGFRDQGFENSIDDGAVPALRGGVIIV